MIFGLDKIKDSELRSRLEDLLTSAAYRKAFGTDEYSAVMNPAGIYPPVDIYPLPKPELERLPRLDMVLMDMDGTTTTTEVLCLHSLETMVRRMSGDPALQLDKTKDYPHIIGNSTTKHVEYLVSKYKGSFDTAAMKAAFDEAVAWTIKYSPDANRKNEAKTASNLFAGRLQTDAAPSPLDDLALVRIGIEIYYQRYHFILHNIAKGKSDAMAAELTGGRNLVEPMEGIAFFLAFIKGWLADDPEFIREYCGLGPAATQKISALAARFAAKDAKVGLITSSIAYEADIVLNEVFRLISKEISAWPLPAKRKQELMKRFKSYAAYYDAVVTASDSNEIRLKPHRDLYAIALQRLAHKPDDIVLGLEDSESGILALRAAGISYAVAVPFEHTRGHDLEAAWKIVHGGAKSVLLDELLYMKI